MDRTEGFEGREGFVIKGGDTDGKARIECRCLERHQNGYRLVRLTNLCRSDTFAARPPKEEAMVLNSTCLILSLESCFAGSL